MRDQRTPTDPCALTAVEAASAVRTGQISPLELAQAYVERIDRVGPQVRAFVAIDADDILAQAEDRQADLSSGREIGPLHGVPIAVKDVVDVRGLPTRAGSSSTSPAAAQRDSESVRALRAAGAVILGKTVTHELGYGVVSSPTANPWDLTRIPGGSSGGSAAAVRANLAAVAIGSDTSGSVRIPASLCGVVGYKPTYGLVSRHGVTPFAWSMDTLGVLARDARDAAVTFRAMAGPDSRDEGSVSVESWTGFTMPDPAHWNDGVLAGLRIGIPDQYFNDHIAEPVKAAIDRSLLQLESMGARLSTIDASFLTAAMDIQYAILRPEASAYHGEALRERPESFGYRVEQLLRLGTTVPASAYVNAQRLRASIRTEFRQRFEQVDLIVGPTSPTVAPLVGSETVEIAGRTEPLSPAFVRLTVPASLAGIPTVSVPCGMHDGLPIGLQLMARPYDDDRLLQVADAFLAAQGPLPRPALLED